MNFETEVSIAAGVVAWAFGAPLIMCMIGEFMGDDSNLWFLAAGALWPVTAVCLALAMLVIWAVNWWVVLVPRTAQRRLQEFLRSEWDSLKTDLL